MLREASESDPAEPSGPIHRAADEGQSAMAARRSAAVAEVMLIATALMWGINIPIVKYAIGYMDPIVFNATRLAFAAVALALCASIEPRRWKPATSTPIGWGRLWVFSLLSGLVYQFLFILAVQRTTASNAALLLSTMPMWTAIFSLIFLRERLGRLAWSGLILSMLGTALVTLSKSEINVAAEFVLGNVLMLAAAMSWAAATVMSRRILNSMSPLRLAFVASAITAPIHLLIVSPVLPTSLPPISAGWMWGAIIYSGAFSTGFAYVTWNAGVWRLGGSHAAVYQSLVTIIAVAGGWIFLREQPLWAQFIGGTAIIGGLLLMRHGRQRAG